MHPLVEVRIKLAPALADWLDRQAAERFESRAQLVRHLIVSYYVYAVRQG